MNSELEGALATWETGGLSRDELLRRFPGEDVAGLLTAFERMQAAGTGPTPDPAAAWAAIRPQLPVPLAHRRRRSRGVRLLAAALVALLAMGATAYAFVPGVRRAIGAAFGSDTAPRRPTTDLGTLVDDPTPGSDGAAASEDEASAGTDERNDEGREQGEDHEGSAQEQGEDEGNGSDQDAEASDDGASGEDQGAQGSGSEEASGGGNDHDAERPEQPEDGNSGN